MKEIIELMDRVSAKVDAQIKREKERRAARKKAARTAVKKNSAAKKGEIAGIVNELRLAAAELSRKTSTAEPAPHPQLN